MLSAPDSVVWQVKVHHMEYSPMLLQPINPTALLQRLEQEQAGALLVLASSVNRKGIGLETAQVGLRCVQCNVMHCWCPNAF